MNINELSVSSHVRLISIILCYILSHVDENCATICIAVVCKWTKMYGMIQNSRPTSLLAKLNFSPRGLSRELNECTKEYQGTTTLQRRGQRQHATPLTAILLLGDPNSTNNHSHYHQRCLPTPYARRHAAPPPRRHHRW